MSKRDKRIDAYIAKSAGFARPVLNYIREAVHAACPEAEETMKWSSPMFMYHGTNMVGMAAFKEHCRLIFWQSELIAGADGAQPNVEQIGKPASVAELPSKKQFASYIRQSMKRIDEGARPAKTGPGRAAEAEVPDDFAAALKKKPKARQAFEAFSPSHRREYVEWITEAKRADTRSKRIATAVAWIADGKSRNWKYM